MFDVCIMEIIFRFDFEIKNLVMRRKNEVVVIRAIVIEEFIFNWRIWEGVEEGVLDFLYRGLFLLIREDYFY